jgi:hypothetical protein
MKASSIAGKDLFYFPEAGLTGKKIRSCTETTEFEWIKNIHLLASIAAHCFFSSGYKMLEVTGYLGMYFAEVYSKFIRESL